MNDWLEKIRKKPRQEKLKLIWAAVILVIILMTAIWIFSARLISNQPKDTTLFQTIDQGIKDVQRNYGKSR